MTKMRNTLRSAFNRVLRIENRRAVIRPGRLEHVPGFESAVLGNARNLTVYLPAGYDEREEARYPVLYMQDGQNLFDPARSFIPGQHWRLREAADTAIGERTAQPMIIVGIDHAGPARADEYTPTGDVKRRAGGRADDYGRFLIEELKPTIDAGFRTNSDDTAIGGSSFGGLVSAYLMLKHPDMFRRAMIMSPSVWWDNRVLLGEVDRFQPRRRYPRVWLDIGGREGIEALSDTRALRDRLIAKGWGEYDFRYYEDRRADHSERAWAARVRQALDFLFPPA